MVINQIVWSINRYFIIADAFIEWFLNRKMTNVKQKKRKEKKWKDKNMKLHKSNRRHRNVGFQNTHSFQFCDIQKERREREEKIFKQMCFRRILLSAFFTIEMKLRFILHYFDTWQSDVIPFINSEVLCGLDFN